MGEPRLYKIRQDIVNFIKPKNGFNDSENKNSLVVFTKRNDFAILESFLEQFYDIDSDVNIEIFSMEELFYVLKQKSQEEGISGDVTIINIYISNILLERDPFITQDGLGCNVSAGILLPHIFFSVIVAINHRSHNSPLFFQFHDEEDVSEYCALSQVVRWCFIFADHICHELGIVAKPGSHLPANADVRPILATKREPQVSSVS